MIQETEKLHEVTLFIEVAESGNSQVNFWRSALWILLPPHLLLNREQYIPQTVIGDNGNGITKQWTMYDNNKGWKISGRENKMRKEVGGDSWNNSE